MYLFSNQMFANSNLVLSIDRTKESAISVLLLTFLLLPTSLVSSSIHQFPFVHLVLPKQIRDRLCVGLSNDSTERCVFFITGKNCSPAFGAFTHFSIPSPGLKSSRQLIKADSCTIFFSGTIQIFVHISSSIYFD